MYNTFFIHSSVDGHEEGIEDSTKQDVSTEFIGQVLPGNLAQVCSVSPGAEEPKGQVTGFRQGNGRDRKEEEVGV